jgi:hypothetical protein
MSAVMSSPCLLAAAASVRQTVSSRLLEGFSEWWEMPAALAVAAAVAALTVWLVRRDAAELPRGVRWLLVALRVAAVAAVAAALLDFERTAEREIVSPSRVAVLVDTSASMTLDDGAAGGSRAERARALLAEGGLLAALAARHEVAVWRFDADAERVTTLPPPGATADAAANDADAAPADPDWSQRLTPRGYETRLGEALARVVEQEPVAVLAGVIVLTDGGNNAGLDPVAAAGSLAAAAVPVRPLGIGAEQLPANVRVADLIVPSRVFPGDRFAVTAYLQPQGLAGETVRVELFEGPVAGDAAPAGPRRSVDVADVVLGADGELVAVRFDAPGLETPGRRSLAVRVVAPAADRTPADDAQETEIEVVDRVTEVLLLAGGPSREYQFMRNVLQRDKSFAVDVLLGTAAAGVSQDARRILDAFPASDEALGGYDAVVAFDYDWRLLDPAAVARLDRWVARESGGLLLFAGGMFTDAWPTEPHTAAIRGLYPVELRRSPRFGAGATGAREPSPLAFTREGRDAEFLWLAGSRVANQTVWAEFPGVYACHETGGAKPGATVYARVAAGGVAGDDRQPVYLAGQFYGSGSVLYVGSGELWRLRAIDDAVYERLAAQLVRHVSQGRLLRGGRRARLLVERDRFPVGATVAVRVVLPDPATAAGHVCRVVGPDGTALPVPLAAEPGRPDSLQGGFLATREGRWQIEVEAAGDEKLTRRVQVQLPDRELARPLLDRGLLEQVAAATGGRPLFPGSEWTRADTERLVAAIPDRSRREYEAGADDTDFKRRLNGTLLGVAVGCLCLEWIVRRLAKLA